MGEISPKEKVLKVAITSGRVTYEKFTPISKLPDEVAKQAKERGFIAEYGKIYTPPKETNIDYKRKFEQATREIASLKDTIGKMNKEIAALKKPSKPANDSA